MNNILRQIEQKISATISKKDFCPAPFHMPVRNDDIVVGRLTKRQKALYTIIDKGAESPVIINEAARMLDHEIKSDRRVLKKKKGGNRHRLAICRNFWLVLF